MQVDPIKPELKAPETHLSTLKCDEPLSLFAFNFNLRRYIMGGALLAIEKGFMVRWCRLKPADPPGVESALASKLGEAPYGPLFPPMDHCFLAPYGPLFPDSDIWRRPPLHHSALESKM